MIDLTVPFEEDMPALGGLPEFEADQLASHEDNGNVVHAFSSNTHQGTHVDAPSHYVREGETVDELDLGVLTGSAAVFDLRESRGEAIGEEELAAAAPVPAGEIERALLVSGDMDASYYSDENFFENAAYLTIEAADWLVEQDVSLIGNDFMTEAVPGDPDRPVHNRLLGAGIPIVEYLYNTEPLLDHEVVDFGCLPLSIAGFEAAPARAYARV